MCQDGNDFTFKCFNLEANLELTPTGVIKNLELVNPSFVNEFQRSRQVCKNIIIAND